eukprot:XP_028357097.1 centrosomal protein of 295 kDa isoform X7 [Physeter catodon]
MKMKRKVVNAAGKLRLSPNEEAVILKEDYERRRKLRLLQVREQERDIALQIREDIKQRRNQQLTRLAEELRTEWEESQTQKIKNLEKLYLASLRNMGEGHQQAKENEPDLNALAHRAAERKKKAEMRHKEALKVQKNQKEMLMKQKTWHIKARKEALLAEKERSAKITSLPPPPPTLFENIEVKKTSNVKTNSSTYHHLYTFVHREVDTKQPDPHLAAKEEAKRLEELQKQAAEERMEQCEKALARGFQAMKKIHLAQNQEKLMKELKQLQQEDLARRRQMVARMPPQLVELPYKRSEMKDDWQRELEFAFEDMYNADKKVKGNLILHLEPEPLPTVTNQIQDEELDLSMEQEISGETENIPVTEAETICSSEADVPLAMKTHQIPSKILFKKLLNKIRNQKSLWTIKSMSEDESEMNTTVNETESKALTVESGATVSEDRTLSSGQKQVVESDTLTVDSGPLTSEDKPLSFNTDSEEEQEMKETHPITAVAQSSVLLHPQEEAARIRMAARQKQIMEIEEQKQKQLELLEQIEQQKLRLETECFRAQLEEEKRKKTQQTGVSTAPASCTISSDEDNHRQMIHNYQQQLLQQNRLHKQSVETARKRLLDYQTMLKGKYPSMSATPLIPGSVTSVPPQKSERRAVTSEHEDQAQQDNLGLQKQMELQKEVLHYGQKAQEESLVQRQTALQQHIQKHQETLKDFFKDSQTSKPTVENYFETKKLRECLVHLQDLAKDNQENIGTAGRRNCDDNQLLSEDSNAKQSGEHQDKELGGKSSKPPVAKVKGGLDLNQHELSAIQEVESPASGRTSILGKPDFYQDRDPLRVSVSREQSFLGSPLDCDPFGHLHPVAQENICGDDSDKAVNVSEAVVENHAVLSYAVKEEDHTYLGPNVKLDDKAETQEIYHEPLSSITVSTGSFLSYENTDLSLTESFSELVDQREQESPTSKEEERNVLSSVVPSTQVIYQRQDPQDALKPLLPALETFTSGQTHIQQMIDKYINEANLMTEKTDLWVDFDFPELEHSFPNLHRQLFKPLEPHPDFDSSSSFSGISQDSKDFYQRSDSSCESLRSSLSPKSTASFKVRRTSLHSSLNTSLNQQPDPNWARDEAQSFATENVIEGSEQSFQQLLPEFSSQEGSQHADLPSIFSSIEARDYSQGAENQYSSEQSEILQNKQKSVHFQLFVGNLQSSVFSSSGEANVFHQLNLQHSTPCGSTSSECSIKDQPEGRKERLGFEELSERGVSTVLQGQGLTDDKETSGVLNINPQLCVRTSIQTPYSVTVQNEKRLEDSTTAESPTIIGNQTQLAQSELFVSSGSFSLQNSIPIWETECGHGIMEEPELTLISNSDISIAEMDFANLTLEEKREDEAKSCFQVSEFLPLLSETQNSDCPAASEHPVEKPAVCAETLSKFTATPGSLQEAFMKRKKEFMERSSQRQKEIRNKIRVSGSSQTKIVKEKPTGSFVSHLKGVNKVRVSLPEDRKTAQAHMHQRALRLYHQLPEVKKQKEEKAKQDAYAQNRARAKEFHKKTLEKLRAKNTC